MMDGAGQGQLIRPRKQILVSVGIFFDLLATQTKPSPSRLLNISGRGSIEIARSHLAIAQQS
jgi:hypothetical protein